MLRSGLTAKISMEKNGFMFDSSSDDETVSKTSVGQMGQIETIGLSVSQCPSNPNFTNGFELT
jgi:hypothetical protein